MIRRWKARRAAKRATVECETCSRRVPRRQAVVLTSTWADEEIPEAGTAIVATFCRRHDPR